MFAVFVSVKLQPQLQPRTFPVLNDGKCVWFHGARLARYMPTPNGVEIEKQSKRSIPHDSRTVVEIDCWFPNLGVCNLGGDSQPILAPVYRLRGTELGAIGLYKLVPHDDDSAQVRRARRPDSPSQVEGS